MASLQAYETALDYAYAPGIFPSMECIRKCPERALRLLIHSKAGNSRGVSELITLCIKKGIRVEEADRALRRISGKDNCFAAVVFDKKSKPLEPHANHIVLHETSDQGNLGTILRTALGFGFHNVAVIKPCTDVYEPKVVRASMGALFSMNIHVFDNFDAYREKYPKQKCYPFMLNGAQTLDEVAIELPFSLVFGNEGKGLPDCFQDIGQPVRIAHSQEIDSLNLSVAAAIGMYTFANQKE